VFILSQLDSGKQEALRLLKYGSMKKKINEKLDSEDVDEGKERVRAAWAW
jgi:hypothetical protein